MIPVCQHTAALACHWWGPGRPLAWNRNNIHQTQQDLRPILRSLPVKNYFTAFRQLITYIRMFRQRHISYIKCLKTQYSMNTGCRNKIRPVYNDKVLSMVLQTSCIWVVCHLRVEHDFAKQHVFEGCDGSGAINGVVALKGLVEVGVSRLPVFLLRCVNDPWKHNQTHTEMSS